MECGRYDISKSIFLDTSCSCLSGGVWACNTDPNGVFESKYGTKIRMLGLDYPAVLIGRHSSPVSGAAIKDIGFQGDISGMDTRPLADFSMPEKASGICFDTGRADQCYFEKLAFCGLGNGIVATGTAEIDACTFEKLNLDGCGNGIWFAPKASYYTRFRSCVVADNPYYGAYVCGADRHIHNLEIIDSYFVRNGGAFAGEEAAAVYFDRVSDCSVINCVFDAPGTFWFYEETATENRQRQPSHRSTIGLRIKGNRNRIRNNTFLNSSAESILVEGNGNVLIGNIVDGDVHICGDNNVISGLVFTKPEARVVLLGSAAENTEIYGVDESRVVRVEETNGKKGGI